jgi:hypothetical protein
MRVTQGQVDHEWRHLLLKLSVRNPALHRELACHPRQECHPLFDVRPGPVEPWERI